MFLLWAVFQWFSFEAEASPLPCDSPPWVAVTLEEGLNTSRISLNQEGDASGLERSSRVKPLSPWRRWILSGLLVLGGFLALEAPLRERFPLGRVYDLVLPLMALFASLGLLAWAFLLFWGGRKWWFDVLPQTLLLLLSWILLMESRQRRGKSTQSLGGRILVPQRRAKWPPMTLESWGRRRCVALGLLSPILALLHLLFGGLTFI
jgi:hypothetical protein